MRQQFLNLTRSFAKERLKHAWRSCSASWKFGSTHDVFWQVGEIGCFTKCSLFLPSWIALPIERQTVGFAAVRPPEERDSHFKRMGHGMTVDQP